MKYIKIFFHYHTSGDIVLKINRKNEYQTIYGFGGAFTDAAGINIFNLSTKAQEKLIKYYLIT